MNRNERIKMLEAWLARPGNSAAALAAALGYKTSATISKWKKRGIPDHAWKHVEQIIRRK